MPGIDPAEIATGLMLDAARSVTRLQVKNAAGDHPEASALSDAEFETLLDDIAAVIETADIEIDTGSA